MKPSELYDIVEKLKYETNPATADLLLDFWETHYGIARNTNSTPEQRRGRIVAKMQSRGPCNKVKLENAISAALDGAPVDIIENTAQNQFEINIRQAVPSIAPAVAVVERMKPAHLIYTMRVATLTVSTAELKTAVAMTRSEQFKVEVHQ